MRSLYLVTCSSDNVLEGILPINYIFSTSIKANVYYNLSVHIQLIKKVYVSCIVITNIAILV